MDVELQLVSLLRSAGENVNSTGRSQNRLRGYDEATCPHTIQPSSFLPPKACHKLS